jgi:hypothetical protein
MTIGQELLLYALFLEILASYEGYSNHFIVKFGLYNDEHQFIHQMAIMFACCGGNFLVVVVNNSPIKAEL